MQQKYPASHEAEVMIGCSTAGPFSIAVGNEQLFYSHPEALLT